MKTLIIIGLILSFSAIVLLFTVLFSIIFDWIEHKNMERQLNKGTHSVFKVDCDIYNHFKKKDVAKTDKGNTYIVLKKYIFGKDDLYIFCKKLN